MMSRRVRTARTAFLVGVAMVGLAGCSDSDDNGTGPSGETGIFVLNSTGQTIGAFRLSENTLEAVGTAVTLPENFDGVIMDAVDRLAVSTISAQGGSQVVFANTSTGQTVTGVFPGPDAGAVDPSKPTLSFFSAGQVETWIGGRGSDAVYRIEPGDQTAELWLENVGTTIERVLPIQDLLLAIDARLDDTADDGDPADFQPLGPSEVVFIDRLSRTVETRLSLSGAVDALNASDGLFAGQELIVLGQGTFEFTGGNFQLGNNGTISVVTLGARQLREVLPLGGNALSMEPGLDNLAYIVRQTSFDGPTDILTFEPFQESFVRGPDDPIEPTDAGGNRVSCWAATALQDGRILCVTFSVAQAGRLYLFDEDGGHLDDVQGGFGSTDLFIPR